MNGFAKLHPFVQLLFFVVIIISSLSFSNPFISAISLLFSLVYCFADNGARAFKTLLFSFAVISAVGLFNMLFAHYGNDVLFKINETEFTLESLFFGINQGVMLASSLIWFTALGKCLDSERVIYLFRFAPKTALTFSMVIGFIPRFLTKLSDIRNAKAALGGGKQGKTIKEKMSFALDNFSALINYALESSIITAESMTARGYNPRAVRAGRFKLSSFDLIILSVVIVLSAEVIIQKALGNLSFVFEPEIYFERISIPALICFVFLSFLPSLLIFLENIKWKLSTVKA